MSQHRTDWLAGVYASPADVDVVVETVDCEGVQRVLEVGVVIVLKVWVGSYFLKLLIFSYQR